MKASELMLGDWVSVDGFQVDDDGKNPVYQLLTRQVQGLRKGVVTIDCYEFYPGLCMPIPLTQEILDKNGFEKIEGCVTDEAYILDKGEWGEVNLIIRRFDFNESFVICTPKDQTARISIGYVHELQHALRLAGIKKEIVL